MPGNENKVCKLIKYLYGLKQAPKQWNQKFDEVVLSNGYLLNQADRCVYSKFDESSKGVIICLYVDDMLIFALTKFRLAISQSHYIEKAVSQLEYSRVIGYLIYAMTCIKPDIAFAVGKLSRYTSNPVLEGYTDASWINNTEDNSSTSGWVFLLAVGKEAEWLINLLLEILLWSKPITPISIHCVSAATLAKAYSQMYNGKSRHLGVRHSTIRELIINGVVSIEFVSS
ncbi:zinc finger, CCHC-type containing protein [Tanacetum coccineum]